MKSVLRQLIKECIRELKEYEEEDSDEYSDYMNSAGWDFSKSRKSPLKIGWKYADVSHLNSSDAHSLIRMLDHYAKGGWSTSEISISSDTNERDFNWIVVDSFNSRAMQACRQFNIKLSVQRPTNR